MPEGHTIHRVARDHNQRFAGQSLQVSSPQGRFTAGAKKLDGQMLGHVEAHGKHLFYFWENGKTLHIHLGLYGKFRKHKSPPPEPRGAVRLRVVGEEHAFDLNGPTACEILTAAKVNAIRERLGEDPLRKDADVEKVWQRIHRSRSAIGKLLLDQSVLAGVGNVYRAEVLFQHQISPERPGKMLERSEFDAVWETLVQWLQIGVKYNRIITVDAKTLGKTPSRLTKAERLLCYKKELCPRCEAEIQTWVQAARKIYACPHCQAE